MKLKAGLFLLTLGAVGLSACLPKKTKPEPSQTALNLAPPKPEPAVLLGKWRACDSYPQGEIIGIKSSAIEYEFTKQNGVIMVASYFADDRCEIPFTEAMADSYFKEFEEINKAPAPEDVKASVRDLAKGMKEEMNYSATEVHLGEVGVLDFLSLKDPSYTSYRISADTLNVATVCRDLIEEGCEPVGDTPTNRAMDMNEAEVFHRVK